MKRTRNKSLQPAVFCSALCALLAGCALSRDSNSSERAGRDSRATNGRVKELEMSSGRTPPTLEGPLQVDEAVRLALAYHPDLMASRARAEAAIGRKIQAGAFPNPVFSAYMESAHLSGKTTGRAEYPVGITQRLPIGGRLGKAEGVEEALQRRLLFELERRSREVESRARGAFAAALFARDVLEVERELVQGAESAARIAKERVDAGDAPADQQARAELEAARARISARQAEISQQRALVELQGAIGPTALMVSEIEGELEVSLSLPGLEAVLETLAENPTLLARSAAVEESRARVLREEASRIPDIDIGFFYRRLAETDDNALDVGLSIPLPLFDRRQGAIREARAGVIEAEARHRAFESDLATTVQSIYWKLAQELETARLYRDELTPRSEAVLEAADQRYGAGDISLAELIPVRRDHRELRLSYLALLRQIATDWAEFRALVAVPE